MTHHNKLNKTDRHPQAVADGSVRIVPDRFEKVYRMWLENIKDWCACHGPALCTHVLLSGWSRQLARQQESLLPDDDVPYLAP